jgi:hypothetical protein
MLSEVIMSGEGGSSGSARTVSGGCPRQMLRGCGSLPCCVAIALPAEICRVWWLYTSTYW